MGWAHGADLGWGRRPKLHGMQALTAGSAPGGDLGARVGPVPVTPTRASSSHLIDPRGIAGRMLYG
jgi:hypothetical protein